MVKSFCWFYSNQGTYSVCLSELKVLNLFGFEYPFMFVVDRLIQNNLNNKCSTKASFSRESHVQKKIRNLVFLSRAFVCLFMFWFWFTGFNFLGKGTVAPWKGGNPFPFGCRARRTIHDHLLPKFSCQLFSLYNNSFEIRSNHRIKRCCIYI